MQLKQYIILLAIATGLLTGCKKDNIDAPQSRLTGNVLVGKDIVGVRSGGISFEIWQRGYQLFSKIPLNIAQDGSFTATLFDGDYKLVRTKGAGPWADNSDSIDVRVSGNTSVDIPVDPYFIIKNASFQKVGSTIAASFTVQQVNTSKALELVRIYIGPNYILDQNNNAATAQQAAPVNITQPVALTVNIPATLAAESYIYARVGVKTVGVNELMYSVATKVTLK